MDFDWSLLTVVLLVCMGIAIGVWVMLTAHEAGRYLPWTVARASGLTAYGLCTLLVCSGLWLSNPRGRASSIWLFPWHRMLGLFTLAFIALHILAAVADPYAGVGLLGALVPGLSHYRTVPVALGTMAMWSALLVAFTARFPERWGKGIWRIIHRGALVIFVLAFFHGVMTGSDTPFLRYWYAATGLAVIGLAAWRYAANDEGAEQRAPVAFDHRIDPAMPAGSSTPPRDR